MRVVLACGGFPHDVARRKELFPHAPTGRSITRRGRPVTRAMGCAC